MNLTQDESLELSTSVIVNARSLIISGIWTEFSAVPLCSILAILPNRPLVTFICQVSIKKSVERLITVSCDYITGTSFVINNSYNMASVKVFPRVDKLNSKEEAPIYLRVTKNRKSKYIALDAYIKPEDWNEKTGKAKPNATNSFQLNYYLTSKEADAESIALELETKSKSVTALDIKTRILGKPPGDFFAFAEKYGQQMGPEWSIGNYRKFLSVLTKLKV